MAFCCMLLGLSGFIAILYVPLIDAVFFLSSLKVLATDLLILNLLCHCLFILNRNVTECHWKHFKRSFISTGFLKRSRFLIRFASVFPQTTDLFIQPCILNFSSGFFGFFFFMIPFSFVQMYSINRGVKQIQSWESHFHFTGYL